MNTEPDQYHCACPPGYTGKNCQIGRRRPVPQWLTSFGFTWSFKLSKQIKVLSRWSSPSSVLHQPNTPAPPTPVPTEERATRFQQGSSACVRPDGGVRPVPTVSFLFYINTEGWDGSLELTHLCFVRFGRVCIQPMCWRWNLHRQGGRVWVLVPPPVGRDDLPDW